MNDQGVGYDWELTDLGPDAKRIWIGWVSGESHWCVEITGAWCAANCTEFVVANMLPLLGRHSPEKLTLNRAAQRIQVWLNALQMGDIPREWRLVSDRHGDWQRRMELYPFSPGKPTWARWQNVAGRLAQSGLTSRNRAAGFVDKRASSTLRLWMPRYCKGLCNLCCSGTGPNGRLCQSAPCPAPDQPTFDEEELMSVRTTQLSEGEHWPKTGEAK
jgi:hypothetical protein